MKYTSLLTVLFLRLLGLLPSIALPNSELNTLGSVFSPCSPPRRCKETAPLLSTPGAVCRGKSSSRDSIGRQPAPPSLLCRLQRRQPTAVHSGLSNRGLVSCHAWGHGAAVACRLAAGSPLFPRRLAGVQGSQHGCANYPPSRACPACRASRSVWIIPVAGCRV